MPLRRASGEGDPEFFRIQVWPRGQIAFQGTMAGGRRDVPAGVLQQRNQIVGRVADRGALEIKVKFWDMQKPTTFGPEYLTYVMWAISPEGRPVNLGEVLVGSNHRSKLDVTTDLPGICPYRDCRTLLRSAAAQ